VAAAIFGDDSDDKVEYTTLDGFSRFRSLQEGRVDLLARSTTHTMERALNEVRHAFVCSSERSVVFSYL
jgi:ABC-type amino acid transport substrate-binding protein